MNGNFKCLKNCYLNEIKYIYSLYKDLVIYLFCIMRWCQLSNLTDTALLVLHPPHLFLFSLTVHHKTFVHEATPTL